MKLSEQYSLVRWGNRTLGRLTRRDLISVAARVIPRVKELEKNMDGARETTLRLAAGKSELALKLQNEEQAHQRTTGLLASAKSQNEGLQYEVRVSADALKLEQQSRHDTEELLEAVRKDKAEILAQRDAAQHDLSRLESEHEALQSKPGWWSGLFWGAAAASIGWVTGTYSSAIWAWLTRLFT